MVAAGMAGSAVVGWLAHAWYGSDPSCDVETVRESNSRQGQHIRELEEIVEEAPIKNKTKSKIREAVGKVSKDQQDVAKACGQKKKRKGFFRRKFGTLFSSC